MSVTYSLQVLSIKTVGTHFLNEYKASFQARKTWVLTESGAYHKVQVTNQKPFRVDCLHLFVQVNFDFHWNKWKSFWVRLVDILDYLCVACMKEETSKFQEVSIIATDAIKVADTENYCSINNCGWFLTLILFSLITSIAL